MKNKWPEHLLRFREDGRDWARRILARINAGESVAIAIEDMAKRALEIPLGDNHDRN